MKPFLQFFEKIRQSFMELTPARKLSILIAAGVTLSVLAAMVYLANRTEYKVLFSQLSSEDASAIVTKLKEKKLPYEVTSSGNTILVPAEKVSELRLELAGSGLPQGGGVGFEIFDQKTLGVTEFEQQMNYRRALQGELARTIKGLEEIESSRVHIALPKESLFVSEEKKPTASVTLKLKQGRSLSASQIEGIAHLVASSVEGLNADDVIIVDNKGSILSKLKGEAGLSGLSSSQVEFQRNLEKDTAARIQSLLENVVGQGKAVVRVAADLDFRVAEKTEESYDPESPVVRSTQKQSEKAANSGAANSSAGQERLDEIINYEINKTVTKTVMPTGEIKKLSIAVLVDGVYTKDKKGVESYSPRDKKEIESIEQLVRTSAGFSASRGDQVAVTNMPFKKVDSEDAESGTAWIGNGLERYSSLIKYLLLFVVVVLAFFFVIRPLIRGIAGQMSEKAIGNEALPVDVIELKGNSSALALMPVPEKELSEVELARKLAMEDSKAFAELLRNWLK
ncbi:flagellar basal-body MS-ring/collar protein FliF [Syntrophus gentianae]|nr:flagellar basal-body MS-ring/collar protein FliF [Syntrophus gentianae]